MRLEKAREARREIFEVLARHFDIIPFDIDIIDRKIKARVFGLELVEIHGFDTKVLDSITNTDWNELDSRHLHIGIFGYSKRRMISWSDNTRQPYDGELLLKVSFPEGSYIFGENGSSDIFNQLFNELKGMGPKYADSRNNSLYFSMENAGPVYNSFADMLKKYSDLNQESVKQRKIRKMEEELARLKGVIVAS